MLSREAPTLQETRAILAAGEAAGGTGAISVLAPLFRLHLAVQSMCPLRVALREDNGRWAGDKRLYSHLGTGTKPPGLQTP